MRETKKKKGLQAQRGAADGTQFMCLYFVN